MYLLRTRQPVWLALLAWLWLGLTAQLQAAPGTGQLKLLPGSYKILLYVMDPYRAYKAELELQVADNLTGINGRSSYDGRKCAGTLSATSLTASTQQLAHAAKQKALQAEQQKIAAEEQRKAKELAAYMQQKNIGEQVCKEGNCASATPAATISVTRALPCAPAA